MPRTVQADALRDREAQHRARPHRSPLAGTFGPDWLKPGAEIRIKDTSGRIVARGMLSDDGLSIIAADGVSRIAMTLEAGWAAELRLRGARVTRAIRAA
ncbi:MAG: hypothetical protein M3081_11645 [Gemmatimonadota bacterium]|nr:hypothetical protein [Gemmatimonadota bacterium]